MSDSICIEPQANQTPQSLEASSENRFKKYLAVFFAIVTLLALILIAINWWIDPLQFYRKASYPPFLNGQKRFQNPGLAKNYEYNAVVIGTSVSENFRAESIRKNLGFDSLNLSMQGASAREQSLMLRTALRTGKVKNVIWDIQFEYLRGDPKWVANYDGIFPYYFYDTNPFNEIHHYLLNIDTAKSSLKILLKHAGLNPYAHQDLEEFYTWDTKKKFGKASVQNAWERAIGRRSALQQQAPEYALANLNANFDINFLQLINKHPEVTFHLYFPPFTPGFYVNLRAASPEIFQNMLANKEHIFAQAGDLENVRLHDFQILPATILAIENFCDSMHFNRNVSEYIIESIGARRHLAIAPNVQELKSFVEGPITSQWIEEISR